MAERLVDVEKAIGSIPIARTPCPGAEIGRQAALRSLWGLSPWRFKSSPGHMQPGRCKNITHYVLVFMNNKSKTKGFTLVELLVVIAIIGLLASIVLVAVQGPRTSARDAKRLADIHQMQVALELYHHSFDRYPDSDFVGCGGWDTPGDGTFITPLVSNNFLSAHILDPITNDDCGNYQYYRYPADTSGCVRPFYVLRIINMETSDGLHPSSPGWSCPSQDWQGGSEWVTGSFE